MRACSCHAQKRRSRSARQQEKKVEELDAVEALTERVVAFETVETESTPAKEEMVSGDIKVEVHATAVHHDQVLEPKMAHAMSHEISHSQAVSGADKLSRTSFN